jgi:hypothetical protein
MGMKLKENVVYLGIERFFLHVITELVLKESMLEFD